MSGQLTRLLDRLVAVGADVRMAVEQQDLDAITKYMDQREMVIQQLTEGYSKEEVQQHPDWPDVSDRLDEQEQAISGGLDALKNEVQKELADVNRFMHARSSYNDDDQADSGSSILNLHVRG